jgi:hypothetical protein
MIFFSHEMQGKTRRWNRWGFREIPYFLCKKQKNGVMIDETPASEQASKQQVEHLFQIEMLELDGV